MGNPEKPIKMVRTDTFEESNGVANSLGSQLIETRYGQVRTVDAPGYTTMIVERDDPALSRIAMLLYDPARQGEPHGVGMICQMSAQEARTIAASLLRLATRLDPTKPN